MCHIGSDKMTSIIPPLSDKEIKEIQEMYFDKEMTIPEIQKKTGRSTSTIDKYIHKPRITEIKEEPPGPNPTEQPTKPDVSVKTVPEPKPAKVIEEPVGVLLKPAPLSDVYAEVPEPDIWLQNFLSNYKLREPFITVQCNRVKRRNELPHPADLMADMQQMDSGQKYPRQIAFIIDDYDFELKKYMQQRADLEQMPQRRHGISTGGRMQRYDAGGRGIPLREREQHRDYYDDRCDYRGEYDSRYGPPPREERRGIPIEPYYANQPYPHLETELERFARLQQLFQKTEEKNPMMERLTQDNRELAERLAGIENDRKQEMITELNRLRMGLQQSQDIRAETENRLRQMELMQSKTSVSESDIRMQEIKDKQDLELRKLDEKGKTREAISNAVTTGFGQIGQAIFKTAQELGSEEKIQMEGTAQGEMWQSACPYCNELITAPLSAKMIQCPSCGRRLEISPQGPAPQQSRSQASFTVQPPIEQPLVEPQIAECPHCKTQMSVPVGAHMIECPNCHGRLTVESEAPIKTYEEPTPLPVDTTDVLKYPKPEKYPEVKQQPVIPEHYDGEPETKEVDGQPISAERLEEIIEQEKIEPHLVESAEKLEEEIRKEPEIQEPMPPEEKTMPIPVEQPTSKAMEKIKEEEDVKEIAKSLAIGAGVKKLEGELNKSKRSLSKYNIFMSECIKKGGNFKTCAIEWQKKKTQKGE